MMQAPEGRQTLPLHIGAAVPQSYTCLHYHLVFSTKHREPTITPAIRPRLHAYLGGVVRAEGGHPVTIGGMPDHVHVLARLSHTKAVADACGW